MGILGQTSNDQNCIKTTNKIPEYARDFKKEWLFIRGINKTCFCFMEKYESGAIQPFVSSCSNSIRYFIKKILKYQKRGYIKDISCFTFKKSDVISIENLMLTLIFDFDDDEEENEYTLGYNDFYSLFCDFNDKIKIRDYEENEDYDESNLPIEYYSAPSELEEYLNRLDLYSDSDSDSD